MPHQFIATIFELAAAGEIGEDHAVRAIENVIVAASPSLFVGPQEEALKIRLAQVFAALGNNSLTQTEAIADVSDLLQTVIERRAGRWEFLPPSQSPRTST